MQYIDETLWLSQKGMSKVFDVQIPDISKRLTDIYNDERFIRGNKYDSKYFDELLERIKIFE